MRQRIIDATEIVKGTIDDYRKLSRSHYRKDKVGPSAGIWKAVYRGRAVGAIVYTMAVPNVRMREVATAGLTAGLDRTSKLSLINETVRCISRVVVDERLRGFGVGTKLVQLTMPLLKVPIIEAMSVMGRCSSFFEQAGMKAYRPEPDEKKAKLIEAFSYVGIENDMLIWPMKVQKHLSRLSDSDRQFIEKHIRHFLQKFGKRRHMPPGLDRTRFVLEHLSSSPMYYIWFNPLFAENSRVAGHSPLVA